jgi:rhodanese-related sulfurtransferase
VTGAVPGVDVAAALTRLEAGALLLDVRETNEWEAGHAPQAVHLPLGLLSPTAPQLTGATQVVVVCRSGRRSAAAVAALLQHGIDAVNLDGGMQAWRDASAPLVSASGAPTII